MNKITIVHPRLQHLGMTTSSIDAMMNWYRNVLGMELVHRTNSATGDGKEGPSLKAAWVTNDETNHRLAFVELPGLLRTPIRHIIKGSSTLPSSTAHLTSFSEPTLG